MQHTSDAAAAPVFIQRLRVGNQFLLDKNSQSDAFLVLLLGVKVFYKLYDFGNESCLCWCSGEIRRRRWRPVRGETLWELFWNKHIKRLKKNWCLLDTTGNVGSYILFIYFKWQQRCDIWDVCSYCYGVFLNSGWRYRKTFSSLQETK